jgi:hypothetical protein
VPPGQASKYLMKGSPSRGGGGGRARPGGGAQAIMQLGAAPWRRCSPGEGGSRWAVSQCWRRWRWRRACRGGVAGMAFKRPDGLSPGPPSCRRQGFGAGSAVSPRDSRGSRLPLPARRRPRPPIAGGWDRHRRGFGAGSAVHYAPPFFRGSPIEWHWGRGPLGGHQSSTPTRYHTYHTNMA